jgi:hypothetical protein
MDTDLSLQMTATRTLATQTSVQIAVFKKAQETEANLLISLLDSAVAPPPPGQGLKIDKQA